MQTRVIEPTSLPRTAESFHTAAGGVQLFRATHPAADPRGTVLLTHGLSEHSGRYLHVIEYLQKSGLSVVRFDLRGHGRSEGQRGHTDSYDTLMADLSLMAGLTREEHPDLPLFFYGHSLGGNLVANYFLRHPDEVRDVRGVVLSSPWLRLVEKQPPWKVKLVKGVAQVAPRLPIPAYFRPKRLTRDIEAIRQYQHDGLVHHHISVKMAAECYDAAKFARNNAAAWATPLLCTHGTADSITSPQGTIEFAETAPGAKLMLFDDLVHEPHNEPEWESVLEHIRDWIVEQVEPTRSRAAV